MSFPPDPALIKQLSGPMLGVSNVDIDPVINRVAYHTRALLL